MPLILSPSVIRLRRKSGGNVLTSQCSPFNPDGLHDIVGTQCMYCCLPGFVAWVASGMNEGNRRIRELTTGDLRLDGELGHSLMLLCRLWVIRPSFAAFRANSFVRYHEHFETARNDPDRERFLALVDGHESSGQFKRGARFDVATSEGGWGGVYGSYIGHPAWRVMAESGHFPAPVPATLRGAMRAPAMTPAELVDRHSITDPDIHALFAAYLTRRNHDIDFATLRRTIAGRPGS